MFVILKQILYLLCASIMVVGGGAAPVAAAAAPAAGGGAAAAPAAEEKKVSYTYNLLVIFVMTHVCFVLFCNLQMSWFSSYQEEAK